MARERGNLTRDADDAVPVGTVRRDLQIIDNIAAAASEVFGEWFSDRRIFWQQQQPIDLVWQTKFLWRAHHSLARDAEHFSLLNHERLLIARFQRQRKIRQDE